MTNRSFIIGVVLGAVVTAFGFIAHGGYQMLDKGIGDTYRAAYTTDLEGESDLLRLMLLDRIAGQPKDEIRAMMERLGVLDFEKPDEGYLVAGLQGQSGQILVEYSDDKIVNILNYCWSFGGDCAIFEVSD